MKTDNLSIPPVQGQMDRHRWETVNRIFHAALELDSSSIENFVRSTSDGDTEIYAEVMALLRADEKAGSYLETPLLRENLSALFESPLKPEDVLCERFQILRAIAEGGMGHVFEALDTELNVRVALKVIRPEIASVPEALARFRQEVRLARTITHPNVCRTFDIDRETRVLEPETGSKLDLVFLTMELLPGETLASRIKRNGALPIEEAFLLACQIGDALHAAHALGIVHRDIKPSNIMLVPTESATADGKVRAVITDFGLARLNPVLPIANASSLSQTARPIGTLAYMAPEQLDGAPVSPATDIYAFGLVLFEMVTGSRAFPSENLLTGLSQRLTGPPPSPKSLAPRLPDNWCYVIDRCLQVNPSERLQEASEVVTALTGNRRHRTSGHRHLFSSFPFLFSSSRRAFAVVATTIFICVALFAAGFRLYQSRVGSSVTPGALVYLAPVKNETGQNSLDDITELIRAGLAQSVQISLLDQGTVSDKLQQMTKPPDAIIDEPIAREIALRSGAARVVFPTITGSNGNYNLIVEIQQPDVAGVMRNRRSSLKRFSWHTSPSSSDQTAIPESLLTAVREASDWIRLDVGESQHDIARLGSAPEDVTTSSWPALEDFSDAEKLVTQHKGEEAIALLRSAIAHDPKFALAHALLGDVLYTLGRQSEGNVSYRTALETGSEDRLSLRERDRLKGLVCQDTWDFEAAASAYREYTVYYPHDYLGWFRLARPLLMLGRTQESIEALEQAHKVDPARPGAAVQLVRGYLVLGNLPEAHRWLEILRKNFSRDNYLFALGPTQFVEGDYKAAAQTFQALSESSDRGFQETGHILLGNLAAEEGDDQEGIRFLTLAMSNDHDNAAEQLGRAALYCKLHKYDLCIDDLNSALRAEPSPDGLVVASGILGRAISASPRANTSHLRFYLESLHKSNTAEGFGLVAELARQLLSGETVLSGGNAVAAIQAFRKADKLDAPLNSHEYLARALLASATKHPNTSTAASELREAASIYAAVALHPARIWWFSPGYPPGAFADQLESYVEVLPSASSSSATEHTLLTLSRLRHRADSNVISRRPRQVSTHTPLQPVARGR